MGHSPINYVVTREYTMNIQKHNYGVGFKNCASWALEKYPEICHEGDGNPDAHTDTRLNKAI